MAQRQVGFNDERRRPAYESYRPNDNRERERNRDYDRDRERDRDHDRRSDRRVSRGSPDRRGSRPTVKPGDYDSRSRNLPLLNTDASTFNIPNDSGNHGSKSLPVISRNVVLPTPASAKNTSPNPLATSVASTTNMQPPKTTDPSLQPMVDALFRHGELVLGRSMMAPERNKKKRELEKKQNEAKKLLANAKDFPQQTDLIQKVKERDTADYNKINDHYKATDNKYRDSLEGLAAAIVNVSNARQEATAALVVPPSPDPILAIAALESKFIDFQRELTEAHSKIQKLEANEKISQEKIQKLEEENDFLRIEHKTSKDTTKLLDDKLKSLGLGHEKSCEKISSIDSNLKKLPKSAEMKSLKDEVSNLKTEVEKFGKINDDFRSSESRIEGLRHDSEFTAVRNDVTKLQERLQSLVEHKGKVYKDMSSMRSHLKELESFAVSSADLAKTDQLVDRICSEAEQHKQNLQELQNKFMQQLTTLRQSADLSDQVTSLREDVSSFRKELTNIKASAEKDAEEFEALQEVANQWETLDIGALIPDLVKQLDKVVNQLQALEHVVTNREQMGCLTQELPSAKDIVTFGDQQYAPRTVNESSKKEVEGLRSQVERSVQDVSALRGRIDGLESSLKEMVQKTINDGCEAMAEMVDDAIAQVDGLNARVGTLESKGVQARTPAPTPQFDSRVSPQTIDSQLMDRVKAIEDEKFGLSLSELSTRINQITHKENLNEKTVSDNFQNLQKILQNETDQRVKLQEDVKGQLDQQELQMQALNGYISNINTGSIARDIVKRLDEYNKQLGPRVDLAMRRLDATDEQLRMLEKKLQVWVPQQQKRPMSPLNTTSELNKKRKLESTNGASSVAAAARSTASGTYRQQT